MQNQKEQREQTALQNIEVLQGIDRSKYNILVPTVHMQQVSPWHAARIAEVVADSNPESGDVFAVEQKPVKVYEAGQEITKYVDQFAPAKPLLMRIASAAGIIWDPVRCGPTQINRDYVMYQAVGAIRLPDGTWQVLSGRKEIDLTVIRDELYHGYLKKFDKLKNSRYPKDRDKVKDKDRSAWANEQTDGAMIQWRKHKLARAETGAMERVIRAALSMKHAYTKEELDKPFLIPRIDFRPDYNDPQVRAAMIQHGVAAMSNLFAATAPTALAGQTTVDPFMNPANIVNVPDDEQDFSGENTFEADPEDYTKEPDNQEPPAGENTTAQPAPEAEKKDPPAAPQGEQPPAGDQASGNEKPADQENSGTPRCSSCKSFISARTKEYSETVFKRPLCYNCQKAELKKQKEEEGGQK